jgi:autotransporter-associated beta strand protein
LNLNGNLSQTALLQLNGPGLTIYSGTSLGNNQNNGFNLNEGTLRVTTASDWSTLGATGISATGANGWFRNGGGVLEIGADLNGATAGDFTNAIVTAVGANGITFYGDSGVSAFGGNRTVNFGGAGATLIWGANGFLVNVGSTNADGQYAFKLSSAYSNSTVEVQNGINLNARTRVFEVANGSAAVDARLSGNLVGGGVGGIVKNGEGTLALSGTNTYTGVTNVRTGTLQFSRQTALYNNTPANWTAANLVVNSGATVAFNVGGVNEFTTGNVTTLLTNLGGTNGSSTSGFAAGSAIGFDTTNASGSTFTVADNIANSSGIGGGAIGITKLGANTLVLTGTNTYTGNTTVSGGALQVGNAGTGTTGSGAVTVQTGSTLLGTGTVRGSTFDLQNGSTLRPGDAVSDSSYGSLTFTPTANSGGTSNLQGNIILGLSAATTTDATLGGGNEIGSAGYNSWLDGVTGAGNHDRIIFNNPTTGTGYNLNFLTTTGSLQINGNDFTPSFGQVFNLLDWSNLVTTNFSGFSYNTGYLIGNGDEGSDLDLPDLSAVGLVWDFSRFTISGNIAIVPEPSRALLMFVGLCGLLLRRRRR